MLGGIIKIGLGGGCHWCTEAVFASLKGIHSVQQGWLASAPPNDVLSEGVLLEVDLETISVHDLLDIHISTHSAYSDHPMRGKYRSAVYVTDDDSIAGVSQILSDLETEQKDQLVTQVLLLTDFTLQPNEAYRDYFYQDTDKPFCQTHIHPKLKRLVDRHADLLNQKGLDVIGKISE